MTDTFHIWYIDLSCWEEEPYCFGRGQSSSEVTGDKAAKTSKMACCYSGFGGFKGHVRLKGVKLWAHHKTWRNRKVNLRDEPWCNKLPPFRQGITKLLGFLVYPLTLTENLQRLLITSSVPAGDDVWLDKIKSWISWWRKQALLKMSGNAEPISGNFWWNEVYNVKTVAGLNSNSRPMVCEE